MGPLELGLSDPGSRCGGSDKTDSVGWAAFRAMSTTLPNSSPGEHRMPAAHPLTPHSLLVPVMTPSAPHVQLSSSNPRTPGREAGTGTQTHGHACRSPTLRASPRHIPHPRLVLSLRAWLSSDHGVLAGFAKPLDLLGSQRRPSLWPGAAPTGKPAPENSGCHSQARPWKVQGCFLGRGEIPC